MGSLRAPLGFAVLASMAAVAACNALTGASDLEVCTTSTCEAVDGGPPNVVPDAQVVDAGSKDARLDSPVPIDAGPPVDAGTGCQGAIACERVVFLTSGTYTGGLGGTLGADVECQKAADSPTAHARVKGRRVRAWLSTAGASASTRLPHGTLAYRSPTGEVIATSWTDLTDGNLVSGIREDESGMNQNGSTWTGTNPDGTAGTSTCSGWTSGNLPEKGLRGNVGGNGSGWTSLGVGDCNQPNRLYCVEY